LESKVNLHSETIDKIMPALILARKSFKAAIKDGVNDAFKRNGKGSAYATLDSVIDAVSDALLSNGILYTQPTEIREDGRLVLHTRFIHESGQWLGGVYPIHPVKNDPQGEGSAVSYARRYALMALAGIAPEDDDGNAATKTIQKQKETPSVRSGKPQDGMSLEDMPEDRQAVIRDYAEAISQYCKAGDISAAAMEWKNADMEHEEKAAMWFLLESHNRAAINRYLKDN
jgi:hypothetical protein